MRSFLFAFCFLFTLVASQVDYYALLEVTKESTPAQIKRSFRSKSMKVHPDKMQDESEEKQAAAKLMFDRLAIAQDVLTDSDKRWRYEKMMGFEVFDYDEIAWNKIKHRMEDEWAGKGKFSGTKRQVKSKEQTEYESKWDGIALWGGLIGLVVVMVPIFFYSSPKKGKTPAEKRADRAKMVAAEKKKLETLSQKLSAQRKQDAPQRKKGEPRKKA